MKKIVLLLLTVIPLLLNAQVVKQLKKTIELKMPGKVYLTKGDGLEKKAGQDSLPGTRGAAVIWHPEQKKYYAAFAGNQSYPLAVFDVAGKRLSGEDQTCMIDIRGLWYNPTLKKICGNGHSDIGWFSYTLNAKGIPETNEVYIRGMNQPGKNSTGAYNAKNNMVYFLSGNIIEVYNAEGMLEEDSTITLQAGFSKKPDEEDELTNLSEDYNYTTVIYTGAAKIEFGLLNVIENQIELYNRKTGLMTQKLKLPTGATAEPSFNFAYSNGTYWLFDMENRKWTGYK